MKKTKVKKKKTHKMPNGKTLQYHEDENVQKWVLTLFAPEHELSLRWNEKLGLKKQQEEKNFLAEIPRLHLKTSQLMPLKGLRLFMKRVKKPGLPD